MYKLGKKIGNGTYTKVFEALKGEVPIAIKKIKINKTEGMDNWMIRELEIMRYTNHPNVCKANRIEYLKGPDPTILIEMDKYVSSLDKTILEPNLITSVIKDIACGLGYLHANNISHRDLKPSNIMLTKDNNAVIIDFNLAKLVLNDTHTPDICTMLYSSPEMLKSRNYNPFTHDVWSFGTIVFELITGGHPFNKDRQLRVIQKQKAFILEKQLVPDLVHKTVKSTFQTEEFKPLVDIVNIALVSRKTRPRMPSILKILGISQKFECIDEAPAPHINGSLLSKVSKLVKKFFEEYELSGADYAINLFCRFMNGKKGLDGSLVAATSSLLVIKDLHNIDMCLTSDDNPEPFEIFGVKVGDVKKFEMNIIVDVDYRILI